MNRERLQAVLDKALIKPILTPAIILLLLVTAAISHASDELELKSTLESRYEAMKAAMAAQDSTAIRSVLAPDFVSVDVNGAPEGADEMVKEVSGLRPDPNKVSQTIIKSISRAGHKVIVAQQYHMTTTRQISSASTPQTVELLTSSTDTWRLENSRYVIERTETDDLQYSVKGKMVVHKSRQR